MCENNDPYTARDFGLAEWIKNLRLTCFKNNHSSKLPQLILSILIQALCKTVYNFKMLFRHIFPRLMQQYGSHQWSTRLASQFGQQWRFVLFYLTLISTDGHTWCAYNDHFWPWLWVSLVDQLWQLFAICIFLISALKRCVKNPLFSIRGCDAKPFPVLFLRKFQVDDVS